MPESTIKLTTKVSGISQLEKVDSLLKSIKSSTSKPELTSLQPELANQHRPPTSCLSLLISPDAISSSS